MTGAWRERRLVSQPCDRPGQRVQVSAVDVGPGDALVLSVDEQALPAERMVAHEVWSADPGSAMAAVISVTTPR